MIRARFDGEFSSWRDEARRLLKTGLRPEQILWTSATDRQEEMLLESDAPAVDPAPIPTFNVDAVYFQLASQVACLRRDDRWALLYRVLFRLRFENPHLMKVTVDPDVLQMVRGAKEIGRDVHKMHAFVRFKKWEEDGVEKYMAYHEPEHLVVRLAAPFFARRFGDKPWSIFTPDLSAHWDGAKLFYTDGIPRHQFPYTDEMDEIWKTYYRSIFNPARIKLKAMNAEMPSKYWGSLPEAEIIRDLVQEAPERILAMARMQGKSADVPDAKTWDELRDAAKECTACPLYKNATQTVFGEGAKQARIMIVGEQPGDQEDLQGKPFVGPAGEILDEALAAADLDRGDLYVTNAVKHFKFTPRGKFRLHQKPTGSEMHACRPWLEAEVQRIRPRIVVLLGTTAGTSWLGRLPKITAERGKVLNDKSGRCPAVVSWHPAAILRAGSPEERQARLEQLTADLKVAKQFARQEKTNK